MSSSSKGAGKASTSGLCVGIEARLRWRAPGVSLLQRSVRPTLFAYTGFPDREHPIHS